MDKEPLIDTPPSTPDTCTKAVENPLVLKKILEKVEDSSDLLRCRCVSSKWRDLATELLLQRSDIRINFEYDDKLNLYSKAESKTTTENPNHTLSELINLIEHKNQNQSQDQDSDSSQDPVEKFRTNSSSNSNSRWQFPCGFFQFKGGELSHAQVQKFLSLHGENIYGLFLLDFLVIRSDSTSSSLPLSSVSTSTSSSTCDLELCRKLLSVQVPHLHTLYLNLGQFVQCLPCSLNHTKKGCGIASEKEEKNSNSNSSTNSSSISGSSVLTLSNLHTLGVYPMSWPQWHLATPFLDFFKEIIVDIAVNLQSVYFISSHPSSSSLSSLSSSCSSLHLPLGLLNWFQELKKLHLVKSFEFLSYFDPDYIEELEKISMCENLGLRELSIGDARSLTVYSSQRVHSLCQSLGRILWSSRFTIETLRIGNFFYEDLLPGVPFPQGGLVNVKTLVLKDVHSHRKEKIPATCYELSIVDDETGIGIGTGTGNGTGFDGDYGIGTGKLHAIGIGLGHRPRKSPFYHLVPNVEEMIIDDKLLWHRDGTAIGNINVNELPPQIFMSPQSLEDVRLFRSDPQKLEDSLELELQTVKKRSLNRKRRKRRQFIIVFTFSIITLILLSMYAMYTRSVRKGKSGQTVKPICKSICTHNEIDSFFQ